MKIHEMYEGLQEELRSFIPDPMWPSNRAVGIEVEVEGAGNVSPTRLWNVITDGSLRNEGRELLTRLPLAGADLQVAFSELTDILGTAGLVASERTSVHVHVDVRDLTNTQVANILVAYVAVEAALYNYGGKHRYDNIYCPGVTAALEQMNLMRRVVRSSVHEFKHGINSWCKYTGINLRSVREKGSIEFRAHEGTLDANRISKWVCILLRLVEYAISHPRSTIIKHLSKGAEGMLTTVFGDYADDMLQDGIYVQYYKNNLINVLDLCDTTDEYQPERAEGQPQSNVSADVESVISAIESIIREVA